MHYTLYGPESPDQAILFWIVCSINESSGSSGAENPAVRNPYNLTDTFIDMFRLTESSESLNMSAQCFRRTGV